MRSKKIRVVFAFMLTAIILLVSGCGSMQDNNVQGSFETITPAAAKQLMDTESDYVVLDVRTAEEYGQGHIDGAILLPDSEVRAKAAAVLPNKDQLILVYCRSGRRSKLASSELATLGYTNVKDFGGIIEWPYEIVK